MTFFVVSYLLLLTLALTLVPVLLRSYRRGKSLTTILRKTQQDMAETLRAAENYRVACEHAPDGIIIQDMRGRIIWANRAYGRIHGYDTAALIGRNPLEFVFSPDRTPPPEEIEAFRYNAADEEALGLKLYRNTRSDGTDFWNQISVSIRRAADGRESAILVCRDVTEQVERENALRDVSQKLEYEATHDSLTCVPNRAAFMTFMEQTVARPDHRALGLLHIDLDNFKIVNDTHGHSAGDAVLVHTAAIVQATIGDRDLVARIGGDEFVVVCPDTADLAALDRLSTDILTLLEEPFEWSNRIMRVEASIGAAFSDSGDLPPDELLLQADFALYEAKRAGRHCVALYDEDLHARHTRELQYATELTEAIDTGAMDHVFQPKMDLETQQIIGFETLVRWTHPRDGTIPPDAFLPIAKDLGLLGALDLLSMSAAIDEKRRLNLLGYGDIDMAFNASPELLSHPEFINRLIWGIEAAGIERHQIVIEVLENTDFGEATETASHASIISDLRAAGFQVHLDDFGIGFAGLSHLASLDVTGVKIDRGLISVMLEDPTSRKIVRKIVELSNDLGLGVVAEGVEDLHTANTLRAMGCGMMQGYWLSRPLQPEDLASWLANRIAGPQDRSA
ncbi:putative bifunctional diguanylate cyclase/phosphodiesterase [Thalassorhabdomicrobium marinisediminis]|uniref:putative bifunctional diguanylate cyclase/phosphodiesterase n=1 Tax=Thalassorhabdomicrobium marinisediminis TaxID=2170577 RepID=UPI00249291F5|nr:EAL domain-containing protein [Thalassorhabdomicrobium marinisediminis]